MTDDRFEALLASALSDPEIDSALRRRLLAAEEVAGKIREQKEKLLGEFRVEEREEELAEGLLGAHHHDTTTLEQLFTNSVAGLYPRRIVSLIVRRRLVVLRKRGVPSTDPSRRAFTAVRKHIGPRSRPKFRGIVPIDARSLIDTILFGLLRLAIERRVYERRGYFTGELAELDRTVETARVHLQNAVAATDRAVTRRLLAELRVQINALADNSRSVLLPPVRPTGLAEVFDVRYEIPTEAKQDVLRLLRTMPGGAIGVSGPRGAGKSTLLRAIATGVSEIEIGDETRPVIGVLTSAPVQYDGRDFLLHLFANTCTRIVGGRRGIRASSSGDRPSRSG